MLRGHDVQRQASVPVPRDGEFISRYWDEMQPKQHNRQMLFL